MKWSSDSKNDWGRGERARGFDTSLGDVAVILARLRLEADGRVCECSDLFDMLRTQ